MVDGRAAVIGAAVVGIVVDRLGPALPSSLCRPAVSAGLVDGADAAYVERNAAEETIDLRRVVRCVSCCLREAGNVEVAGEEMGRVHGW